MFDQHDVGSISHTSSAETCYKRLARQLERRYVYV